MTTTEAREALIAYAPDINHSIDECNQYCNDRAYPPRYSISVFVPECQQVYGDNLDDVLQLAKELIEISKAQIPPLSL